MPRELPPIPNPRRLEVAITVELYSILAGQSAHYVKPDVLSESLHGIQSGLLTTIARRSSSHGYYRFDRDGDFVLTEDGVDFIMAHAVEPNPDIAAYFENGIAWLTGRDESEPVDPAQTRIDVWEPIPIDRGNEDYVQMLSASQAALQQIEGSNGYADSAPEERNGIVLSIKGALQTISDGQPSRHYIRVSLVGPLQFIAKKFSEGLIGQFAKSAAEAVLKWLENI